MFTSTSTAFRPMDLSASTRGEELGQREAGAAGEVQSGESSVGAETEGGHCTTGEGMTGCVCVCMWVCHLRVTSN